MYQRIGDKRGTAIVLMNLGSYYADHAKYEDALKSTTDALTLYRDLGDEANQALCLNNLGSIRSYMDNFQDALTYYQQAYQIREKLKLTDDMAESLHNLAETNVDLGQYDTAVTQYLKALEIRQKQRRPERRCDQFQQSGRAVRGARQVCFGAECAAGIAEGLSSRPTTRPGSWWRRWAATAMRSPRWAVGTRGRRAWKMQSSSPVEVKNDTVLAPGAELSRRQLLLPRRLRCRPAAIRQSVAGGDQVEEPRVAGGLAVQPGKAGCSARPRGVGDSGVEEAGGGVRDAGIARRCRCSRRSIWPRRCWPTRSRRTRNRNWTAP